MSEHDGYFNNCYNPEGDDNDQAGYNDNREAGAKHDNDSC